MNPAVYKEMNTPNLDRKCGTINKDMPIPVDRKDERYEILKPRGL